MSEWWTYTLSDFLLFSPRTYYRLIERHNAAVWPGQVATLALGLVILGLLGRPRARRGRIVFVILAALWAWIAWAFLWRRYAAINWVAVYCAWLFAIQTLLLVWIGVVRGAVNVRGARNAASMLGTGLFVLALALYPALAPLLGRGWRQAEVFGVAPDPTVVATVGVLLLTEGSARWVVLLAPAIWCAFSGATLWAMGSPESGLLLLVALVTTITITFLPAG